MGLFIVVIGIRSCRAERRKCLLSRMEGWGLEELRGTGEEEKAYLLKAPIRVCQRL